MVSRKRKLRILLLIGLPLAAAIIGGCLWHRRSQTSEVFTTQRPGNPIIVWHTMQARWQRGVFQDGSPATVSDIVPEGASLFLVAGSFVSKIDKASGLIAWTRPLTQSGETWNRGLTWSVQAAPGRLIAAQTGANYERLNKADSRVSCLIANTGKHLWEFKIGGLVASAPAVLGTRILLPLANGEVLCVNTSSGYQFWRRQVSAAPLAPFTNGSNDCSVPKIRADGNSCVVRIGANHFVALDLATGLPLWSRILSKDIRLAEQTDRPVTPFTVHNGIVYVAPQGTRVVAWQASTGKTLWRHVFAVKHGEPAAPLDSDDSPIVISGLVLAKLASGWAAVHCEDGSAAWDRLEVTSSKMSLAGEIYFDSTTRNPDVLYMLDRTDPLINGVQCSCRSLPTVQNMVAISINTGKEAWRWQIETTEAIYAVRVDGPQLYCDAADRVISFAPGRPEPLLNLGESRSQLAYRMVEDLTKWHPNNDTLLGRMTDRLRKFTRQGETALPASGMHAILTLLRLRSASIPPLIQLLRHQTAEADKPGAPIVHSWSRHNEMRIPLDILFDLRAESAVPALVQMLDTMHTPVGRQLVAELLIRLNDPGRSMRALFRYATCCDDSEEIGGEEALNYLCRFAPSKREAKARGICQEELTAYLMACLDNSSSPIWARRYALFELQRDRGPAAFRAAHSRFYYGKRARLMPTMAKLAKQSDIIGSAPQGTGVPFQPTLTTRDGSGTWWGIFQCAYFGRDDIWVVQSTDGRNWRRPTVAFPDESLRPSNFSWHARAGRSSSRLSLHWVDGKNEAHARSVSIADLYRDTDKDGVPDIVEREIGTNPSVKDSGNSGYLDGVNKNPLYVPHRLSQDEQIYQAVIEALCQYGRFKPAVSTTNSWFAEASGIEPDAPLVMPGGPDPRGVPIYGHEATVLQYGPRHMPLTWRFDDTVRLSFRGTFVGFEGRDETNGDGTDPSESDIETPNFSSAPFARWFPYKVSPDGNCARIAAGIDGNYYDVEVRRIEGKWMPVECRMVMLRSLYGHFIAAAPVRNGNP